MDKAARCEIANLRVGPSAASTRTAAAGIQITARFHSLTAARS